MPEGAGSPACARWAVKGMSMCRMFRVALACWMACAAASGCRQPSVSVEAKLDIDPGYLLKSVASKTALQPPGLEEACEETTPPVIGTLSTVTSPEKTPREIC